MNNLLELYKLCCTDDNEYDSCMVSELGWIDDHQFCVWIDYLWVMEFVQKLKEILGEGIFDDGGFDANMQSNCICIDLCEIIDTDDLEEIFPKEKFQH